MCNEHLAISNVEKSSDLPWSKSLFAVFFGLFLTFSAEAAMVSFCVIETGLPENGRDNQQSVLWENAFLDVFFDAGHIIVDAPMLRMQKKPEGSILQHIDMQVMRRTGVEFIIVAQLDFNDTSSPEEITFFIYKVTPGEMIVKKQIEGRQARPAREELEYMKTVARGFTTYIPEW